MRQLTRNKTRHSREGGNPAGRLITRRTLLQPLDTRLRGYDAAKRQSSRLDQTCLTANACADRRLGTLGRIFQRAAIGFAGAALLAACQACAVAGSAETPALLLEPGDAVRNELQAAVAKLLQAPGVLVDASVLLHGSLLLVDRNRPRDAAGRQLSGRDYGKPEQFQLIKAGRDCVLVRLGTGERVLLSEARCKPAPA